MREIYQHLARELAAGRPAVMAEIIRQQGSSPRSLGANFLIHQDGSIVGTIGGGQLEAWVIEAAKSLMGSDSARVMEIRMTGKEVAGTDMICGGNVDVLVKGFDPASASDRQIVEAVSRLLQKGGKGVLAAGPLPFPGQEARIELILHEPDIDGTTSLEASPMVKEMSRLAGGVIEANAARVVRLNEADWVLEPIVSNPAAVIFGGGHISVKLAPILSMVGFQVAVVDDRPEFANPQRFPTATQIVASDYQACFEQLDFDGETYAVIVTRGHLHDKTVLGRVLEQPCRYVGMIGSKRKRNMIYEALLREGVSAEKIRQVHSPIGLDIGAETPEEIAVAIAGEMIRVRSENLRLLKEWKV